MDVKARTQTIHQSQRTEYEVQLSQFQVYFGHRDRDSLQMRLEGGKVYLSDYRDSRATKEKPYISVTVPFELLAKEWVPFIRFLQAKNEEAKGG